MPKVKYVSHEGRETELEIPVGQSVMQAAVANGVEPIVAECGGSCMCATCHVYVTESQLAMTPPMTPAEDAMLEATACERRPNSRDRSLMAASCIVIVGAGHGGVQAAASLRQRGSDARIILISDEDGLPYQCPPVSKAYLQGKMSAELLPLRPAAFYRDNGVELHENGNVEDIDLSMRKVRMRRAAQMRLA
jgi:2Fe-2S ferredoxin